MIHLLRHRTSHAAVGLLTLLLAACATKPPEVVPPTSPVFYNRLDAAGAAVSPETAASLINTYRAAHGLSMVTVDPLLNAMAAKQARAMAASGQVGHNVPGGGSFEKRLAASTFNADVAVENVGAGYRTLAEAFSGWRDSPPHNANMLKGGVTRLGIGTAYAPNSKYKVYWSLILAKPSEPAPLAAGPATTPGRTKLSIGGLVIAQ